MVVTATTLLLKWYAWVHNWVSRKHLWCHDLAKWLSHYLYFFSFLFFSFLIGLTTTRWSAGKYHVTLSQCHKWCDGWSRVVTSPVTVTVCHMTRVTWGPWESKCIAIVVKCISSRELSENSIEFSLSNSEQRDSWLNSGVTLCKRLGKISDYFYLNNKNNQLENQVWPSLLMP